MLKLDTLKVILRIFFLFVLHANKNLFTANKCKLSVYLDFYSKYRLFICVFLAQAAKSAYCFCCLFQNARIDRKSEAHSQIKRSHNIYFYAFKHISMLKRFCCH